MTFTRNDIAALAADEGKSELEMITMLQAAAASTGQNEALEALCAVKAEILGL